MANYQVLSSSSRFLLCFAQQKFGLHTLCTATRVFCLYRTMRFRQSVTHRDTGCRVLLPGWRRTAGREGIRYASDGGLALIPLVPGIQGRRHLPGLIERTCAWQADHPRVAGTRARFSLVCLAKRGTAQRRSLESPGCPGLGMRSGAYVARRLSCASSDPGWLASGRICLGATGFSPFAVCSSLIPVVADVELLPILHSAAQHFI